MGNQVYGSGDFDQNQLITDAQRDESNWQFIQNLDSYAYGEAKLVKDLYGNFQVIKQSVFDNQIASQQYIQKQQFRLNYDCLQLTKFKCVRNQPTQQLCSKFYKVQISIDYFKHTLRDQMDYKIKKFQQFSEFSIINLLFSVLQGLGYLYQGKGSHENIIPQSILYDKKDQSYKITDAKFLSGGTIYDKFLMGSINEKTCSYLSPEQLFFLKRRQQQPFYDKQKSDIFSLGLCALEAGVQQSMQIYDFDLFIIDEKKLQNFLNHFQKSFSTKLYELLYQMLVIEEGGRVNLLQACTQIDILKKNFKQNLDEKSKIVTFNNQSFSQIPLKNSQHKYNYIEEKYQNDVDKNPITQKTSEDLFQIPLTNSEAMSDIDNFPIHRKQQEQSYKAQKNDDSLRLAVSTLEDYIENVDQQYQYHCIRQKYSHNSRESTQLFQSKKNELCVNMDTITFRIPNPYR